MSLKYWVSKKVIFESFGNIVWKPGGTFLSIQCLFREGNGNPLQSSCLENPMDRGAWGTTIHGVAKTQTRLSHWNATTTITSASLVIQWIWLHTDGISVWTVPSSCDRIVSKETTFPSMACFSQVLYILRMLPVSTSPCVNSSWANILHDISFYWDYVGIKIEKNQPIRRCLWLPRFFPGRSVIKNLPANSRDRRYRFDPWVRKSPWRRKWQPTPVFLPGKSHGQRRLVGYCPWQSQRVRHDWA